MFETAILAYIGSALVVTLSGAAGKLILHRWYGPDLPEGVQTLGRAFEAVYMTGTALLFGPFKIFYRGNPPTLPPPNDTKQLPKE